MGNNNLVIALIVAVVFLIAFPMIFSLIKKDNLMQSDNFPPISQQQPPIVGQPPVIVQPAPIIVSPHHRYGLYDKGYNDARRRIQPQCHEPDYMRGYREYCHRHPGFNFHINIK